MNNQLSIKFLTITAVIFAAMTGLLFSGIWLVQLILWVLLSFSIYYVYFKNLSSKSKILFLYIVSSYLIFESFLKLIIYYSDFGGVFLNLLEHFMWSLYFAAIIYYPLSIYLKKQHLLFTTFVLISIVNLIGVGNELVEFILRNIGGLKDLPYYQDTIRDLFMNIVGSGIFSGIILFRNRKLLNAKLKHKK